MEYDPNQTGRSEPASSLQEAQQRAADLRKGMKEEAALMQEQGMVSGARRLKEDLQVAEVVLRRVGLG